MRSTCKLYHNHLVKAHVPWHHDLCHGSKGRQRMRTDNKVIRQVYPLSRAHLAQSQLRIVAPDIQVRQPESKYDNIRIFWQ